jgi:LysM repeat protein/ABC-type branched-subunit amino acid transport system substrate-binding protein
MKKIKLLLFVLSVFVTLQNNAQTPQISKSAIIETVNNQKFYIHTVQPKETLYSICKAYGVSSQDVISNNSNIESGLAIGQTIKIPVSVESTQNKTQTTAPATQVPIEKSKEKIQVNSQDFYIHIIQQGQTLYSLTKLYNVTSQSILDANPGLTANLPIGSKILIPSSNTATATTQEKTTQVVSEAPQIKKVEVTNVTEVPKGLARQNADIAQKEVEPQKEPQVEKTHFEMPKLGAKKQSIRVALILPFFLDMNSIQNNDVEILNKRKEIYPNTYIFMEYYEGALVALDSIRKMGIQVNLEVYDSNKDSANIQDILTKLKPENLDLIIGPVFPNSFALAAEYAQKHKIPIVSPLSSEEIVNKSNPYIIQVNSPQRYRFQEIGKYASQFQNCTVIHVYNSVDLEQDQVNECKRIFTTSFADSIKKNNIQIKEVYFPKQGIAGLEKMLNPNGKNIIVVFSRNQAFVNNLVTKLYQYSKKYDINLLGLPNWEKYENLELDFLFDLQFQFVANGYVDYSQPQVKSFVLDYRNLYKIEPTKYSFQGFDQMLYFSKAIIESGNSLPTYIITKPLVGLYESYNFVKEPNAGIVNSSASMIQYTKSNERKTIDSIQDSSEQDK